MKIKLGAVNHLYPLKDVLRRVPDAAPRLAEPPQLTDEASEIKRGKVSGATGEKQA